MKTTTTSPILLIFLILMTSCVGDPGIEISTENENPPVSTSPLIGKTTRSDAGQNDADRRNPFNYPPVTLDATSADSSRDRNTRTDAGAADANTDATADTTTHRTDSGNDTTTIAPRDSGTDRLSDRTSPDIGIDAARDMAPDLGADSARAQPAWIFSTEEHGVLITAPSDTIATSSEKPDWSQQAIASAVLQRQNGSRYNVLVYTKERNETVTQWMRHSEVGDAFLSGRTIQTADNRTGYVYETNDFGAVPAVHATIATENFVYYFYVETDSFDVPEDFLNFIRSTEVQ